MKNYLKMLFVALALFFFGNTHGHIDSTTKSNIVNSINENDMYNACLHMYKALNYQEEAKGGNDSVEYVFPMNKLLEIKTELMDILTEQGVSIDVRSEYGNTALQSSVMNFDYNKARMLLILGADPKAISPHMSSLIDFVAEAPHNIFINVSKLEASKFIQLLREFGVEHTIFSSVLCGELGIVQKYIDSGAPMNVKNYDRSLLFLACMTRNDEMIRLLTDAGMKHTLETAVQSENVELARQLLDNGACVNEPLCGCGSSHLLDAVKLGNFELVTLLVERGADVHATGCDNTKLSDFAVEFGYTQIAEFLEKKMKEQN